MRPSLSRMHDVGNSMAPAATICRRYVLAALACLAIALAHEPGRAQETVDHSSFETLLRAHVDDAGRVDYDAFARSGDFQRYLALLSRADPERLGDQERLALWINAYNAYTIELINRHGERRSIRNINRTLGFLPGSGPWSERMARVGGHDYTLDEIEHEIIRPRFGEPRIHFALVCAAIGCPPLRREAYTGARLDAQLDDQTRRFLVRSPERNRVDVSRRTLHLSRIFDWYAEDFGGSREAVGRYVAGFLPAGPERDLLIGGDFRIRYTTYDWSLNIQ
jgi:hypothetical protein